MSQDLSPMITETKPGLRAGVTIGTHFVVDVFSFVSVSLLPLLAVMLDLRTEQKALLLALGSLCSGAIQPIVAWASDRFDTRSLGTLGFVLAILCIGNLGMAKNFEQLVILYCLGAVGIGAFHPPAAAIVGHLGGSKRSMLIAIFFLAGMIGGIVGNVFTPRYVEWMTPTVNGEPDSVAGMLSLRWFIPIGLVFAIVLALAIHKIGHRNNSAADHHVAWEPNERRMRWFAVSVLYIANMLRFSVNMALIYLLVEWTEETILIQQNAAVMSAELGIKASQLNGILQAAMQVGMGAVGIMLGFLLSARFEKLAFVVLPILGSLALYLIPRASLIVEGADVPVAIVATILTGVGFGAVIPVSISLAQRLLPHRTSLASGLMLGGAWMLAFVGPIFAELVHKGFASKPNTPKFVLDMIHLLPDGISKQLLEGMGLDAGFTATAVVLFFAGVIALLLPHKLIVDVAKH
ncbi:MAG: MFS transporter [Phycisphaerales bacterium]|nr:MFS transporter [Phycisphaerales bacterium]